MNPADDRLLERVRGTGFAMLATAALFGVALVAMISQQKFSLLPSPPVRGAPGAGQAISPGPAPTASADASVPPTGAPGTTATRFVGVPLAFDAAPGTSGPSAPGPGGDQQLGSSRSLAPEPQASPPPSSDSPQSELDPEPAESQPAPEPVPATGTSAHTPVVTVPTAAGTPQPAATGGEEEGESSVEVPPVGEGPGPEEAPETIPPPIEVPTEPEPEAVEEPPPPAPEEPVAAEPAETPETTPAPTG